MLALLCQSAGEYIQSAEFDETYFWPVWSDWLISSLSHPYCGTVRQLWVRTLEASLTFWQFGQKHARWAATGGHFLGLWQCSSVSSLHKRADTGRVAGLMPVYSPVQVPCVTAHFWYTLEIALGDTENLLVTACMDVASWRSRTSCGTLVGCRSIHQFFCQISRYEAVI